MNDVYRLPVPGMPAACLLTQLFMELGGLPLTDGLTD